MADKNFESYANIDSVTVSGRNIMPPDDSYNDTLKFSNAKNITVSDCTIHGGSEDCIDMNNLTSIAIVKNCHLYSGGQYCSTIKGGTTNIRWTDVVIAKHGSTYDVDLGNWSDQSNDRTTGIVLENVTSLDGNPVTCRVLWADKPQVIGGNVKVTVIPKIFVIIYRFLRSHNWVK